ncbi:MAG: hypothetical protein ACYYKD_07555 [Rhodospirillales bacterium]
MKRIPATAAAAALALTLAACAQNPLGDFGGGAAETPGAGAGESSEGMVMAFTQFPDLPIPSGADMDVENTLVFGGGEGWFGQIALSAPHRANNMYDFYKRNLPSYEWTEITSVRAPTSVMTHARDGRILSIQIADKTLLGSYIVLTVSPREKTPAAAAAVGAGVGAVGAAGSADAMVLPGETLSTAQSN